MAINLELFDAIPENVYTETIILSKFSGNTNDSAQNVADLTNQRLSNTASGTHPVSSCYSGNFRTGKAQNPSLSGAISTEKYPSLHAYGIHSTSSLTKSPSVETPLGVVRLCSSPSIEPVRIHSGTSTESFRRDISLYKLNAMPALEETDHVSDDGADEISGRSKTNDLSKIKKSRRKRLDPGLIEIEDEESHAMQDNLVEASVQKKGKFKGLSQCFKGLFPCTRSNKNDLDPDCLLDVMSNPRET
ncbi:uncharacterized protein LOC123550115 [Mercenaria mercenaria]|uniref:uncharacterized protein LOC123550115 n=1 Tax=Mercenaria mercenaria TaxID=6596 RepID=UPI00234E5657|nr:uncharacterized protein LOC123550115 [Mercenaria mercenaria]